MLLGGQAPSCGACSTSHDRKAHLTRKGAALGLDPRKANKSIMESGRSMLADKCAGQQCNFQVNPDNDVNGKEQVRCSKQHPLTRPFCLDRC